MNTTIKLGAWHTGSKEMAAVCKLAHHTKASWALASPSMACMLLSCLTTVLQSLWFREREVSCTFRAKRGQGFFSPSAVEGAVVVRLDALFV